MTPGMKLRRWTVRSTIALALAASVPVAFPAAAISSDGGDGPLSPRLTELAKPAVRSAPPVRQAKALSLAPSGPGSLLRNGNRVLVDVRFDRGAAAGLTALREAGAKIVNVSRLYQTVTVAATPASLPDLADVARVEGVTEDLAPLVSAPASPPTTSTAGACTGGFGAATSEGDLQTNAMKARNEFGVNGSGVTVGVLSDSFNLDTGAPTTAGEDVLSGDLPGLGNPCGHAASVNVLSEPSAFDDPEPSDEGRAMAQIVHDLAPGASLAFATAFEGELAFAQSIEKLAKPTSAGGAGADVIVDDVSYFEEPFFQEGPVGVAISKVTGEGVSYFSAAGNNNLIDSSSRNISSWEAPAFRDSLACPSALEAISTQFGLNATHCMDFKPKVGETDNTFGMTVSAGATLTVDLQWAEPREGVTTDLDAYLISSNTVVAAATDDNLGEPKKPYELLTWENQTGGPQTVQLAVNRFIGGSPRLKFALLENGSGVTATEYPTSSEGDVVGPTIFGHNGGADAMSVGAIRFNTNSAPEGFSSRGPVTHYYGPVNGTIPALPLGSAQVLAKPDVVATDGGANTFFGSCASSVWRFFGTSAAAPHAAAVAALELSADPSATVSEVKQAQVDTAATVGSFPAGAVGAGLVDASGALGELASPSSPGTAAGPGFPPPVCPPVPKAPAAPAPVTPVPPVPTVAKAAPPETAFALRPHKVVRTHAKSALVSFRFRSDQAGAFSCSVDKTPLHPCQRKLARWFSLGPHRVQVVARNEAGVADPTPASFRFRVVHVR